MKLYQAGYYRLGGRGSGSGWQIVAPSAGMSEIAKAGFRGIAARLADLKQTAQMPSQVMGINRHDRFIYLMHVNYAASAQDGRGAAYIHGYCFHLAQYYELAKHPEMLFGILPDQFDLEYRPDLNVYPVIESWNYQSMDDRKLLDEYRLSNEQYRKLILGAICALEGCCGPLCVKCAAARNQNTKTYKDVMYFIMKGLPYYLRQKLDSFSWHGAQTALYFSDTVQGENYADLDAGLFRCDYSGIANYQFTKIYHMELFYSSQDARERIFQTIAQFIEQAYTDPFKDAGCVQIEAAFQKKIKKNDGGIEPERASGLLQEFLKYEICYDKETAEYIAALLEAMRRGNIRTADKKLASGLEHAYERCADEQLTEPMAWFDAQRILGQKKEEGFAALMRLKNNYANGRYPAVCRCLESMDPDYFAQYFWDRFLPCELTSLKKAEKFHKKNGKSFSVKEQHRFQKLLKTLVLNEMKEAGSFEELSAAAQRIDRIRHDAQQDDGYSQLWEDTCLALWNCFQIEWFDTDSIGRYQQYNVKKLAFRTDQRSCPHAKKVSQLITIFEEAVDCSDVHRLWELLYGGQKELEKETDGKIRNQIRNGVRDCYFSGEKMRVVQNDASGMEKEMVRQLDISLLLCYDPDAKQFHLVKWMGQWANIADGEQLAHAMAQYAKASVLLADAVHKKRVLHCLEQCFKNKTQTAYEYLPQGQKKALRMLYDSLKGRTGRQNTASLAIYSIHREALGLFVMLTIAVCGICLKRYGSGDLFMMMIYAAFLAVGMTAAAVVKILTGSLSGKAAEMGLTSGLAKGLYAGMPLVFAAVAVFVYAKGGFMQKAVCLIGYLVFAAGMIFASGLATKD